MIVGSLVERDNLQTNRSHRVHLLMEATQTYRRRDSLCIVRSFVAHFVTLDTNLAATTPGKYTPWSFEHFGSSGAVELRQDLIQEV